MDLLGDSGYYVVDNLPVALVTSFLALSASGGERYSNTGLLLDIDSQESRRQILPLNREAL
jgi:RNase adaptor protein for sRNA GlmZ degradation